MEAVTCSPLALCTQTHAVVLALPQTLGGALIMGSTCTLPDTVSKLLKALIDFLSKTEQFVWCH